MYSSFTPFSRRCAFVQRKVRAHASKEQRGSPPVRGGLQEPKELSAQRDRHGQLAFSKRQQFARTGAQQQQQPKHDFQLSKQQP